MLLTKKIRIDISETAKEYLEFSSNKCRILYNFALEERINIYKETGKGINVYEQKKGLQQTKEKYPEYKRVYGKNLQEVFFRLDASFQAFFRRVKVGETPGFPRFRGKDYFYTLVYPSMYIKRINDNTFIIPTAKGQKVITAKTHEEIPIAFKEVCITKNKSTWFATFTFEINEVQPSKNQKIFAIDLGVKKMVTAFNGESFFEAKNYKNNKKLLNRLDDLRSKRDRCTKHSRRWYKWNSIFHRELNKRKQKITDFLHKLSYYITAKRTEGTIVVGDLDTQSMPKESKWFNRFIQNEWHNGQFLSMLKYKCLLYGKQLIKINERGTTKGCSNCGRIKEKSLSERIHKCECGLTIDRDRNSGINIWKRFMSGLDHPVLLDVSAIAENQKVDTFVYI
jgi:putative transposase